MVDRELFLKILQEAYLELAGKYCEPVAVKADLLLLPRDKDLYTVVNEKLRKLGLRELSWEEFREILRELDEDSSLWGKMDISWFVSPKTKRLEPVVLAICKPIT
jgi:hypothetical protein